MNVNPEYFNMTSVVSAGSIAGLAGGIVAEKMALRRVGRIQAPLSEVHVRATEALPAEQVSIPQRVGRYALAPLVITGVATGVLTSLMVAPGAVIEHAKPTLEVVVDHSGATRFPIEGVPATQQIDSLAKSLDSDSVETRAWVAGSSAVTAMKLAKVPEDKPFGAAHIGEAVGLAMGQSDKTAAQLKAKGGKHTSGILVLTNNNTWNATTETASQANKTPIYIVNVAGKTAANDPSVQEFKAIAKTTHGHYWNAHTSNLDDVVKQVKSSLVPEQTSRHKVPYRPLYGALAALVGFGGYRQFRDRNKLSTNRGLKGE